MKKVLMITMLLGFITTQSSFANTSSNLKLQIEEISLPKKINGIIKSFTKEKNDLDKKIKLCNSLIVRSVTPCPSGSSGPGVITVTSTTYNSTENGDCNGPTMENLVFAQTETQSWCSVSPE